LFVPVTVKSLSKVPRVFQVSSGLGGYTAAYYECRHRASVRLFDHNPSWHLREWISPERLR
jgi:hypothetical protein